MVRSCMALAALLVLSGCALHPKDNLRLQEARHAYASLPIEVARLAPAEAARAAEALERADQTWASREDPALVDHLAYVARQRAAIAEQVARRVAAERAMAEPYRRTSAARP